MLKNIALLVCWISILYVPISVTLAADQASSVQTTEQVNSEQFNEPNADKPFRILILFGDANVSFWVHEFNQALNKILVADPRVLVHIDFLGLNKIDKSSYNELAMAVDTRHKTLEPDLVISVQPAATKFLLNHGETFASDAAKLFVLPGPDAVAEIKQRDLGQIVPSAWNQAARKTVTTMRKLMPDLKHILVYSGNSVTDLSYLARAKTQIAEESKDINVEYLVGLNKNEILDKTSQAPKDSAILLLSYTKNRSNNITTTSIASMLSANPTAPVFGLFDSLLGFGIAGGELTSAQAYAESAGLLAINVINNDIRIQAPAPKTRSVYDAKQLEQWGLNQDNLPNDAELINNVRSLWDEYAFELVLGAALLIIQTFLIFSLLRALKRRKSAEQERDQNIREKHRQALLFESAINSIQDAVLVTDTRKQIVIANRTGCLATFGYNSDDLLGKNIAFLKEDSVSDPAIDLASISTPTISDFRHAAGSTFPGEAVSVGIQDDDGNIIGYSLMVRDVSARLKAQAAKQQGNKMEALGNLAGGIAHDFNNILMAIMGNTDLALSSFDNETQLEESLNRTLRASERGSDLVNQILTYSRHSEVLDITQQSLTSVMGESLSLLSATIPSNIEFITDTPTDLWETEVNASHIQQVILNLCTNAIHAMPSGGKLKVSTKNLRLCESLSLAKENLPPADYVVLTVSDTGEGMTPELAERIFEPFFTTKEVGKGTGMGLALVHGIVESHNAHLDLQSTRGKGTSFKIYFNALANDAENNHRLTR